MKFQQITESIDISGMDDSSKKEFENWFSMQKEVKELWHLRRRCLWIHTLKEESICSECDDYFPKEE